jgi:hypothetical protein
MAPEPMSQPSPQVFPINKLVPLLRAVADPTGSGEISPENRAMIEQVEANLATADDERDAR